MWRGCVPVNVELLLCGGWSWGEVTVVGSREEGKKRAKLCLKRMKSKPQGRAAVLLCYQQGNHPFSGLWVAALCSSHCVAKCQVAPCQGQNCSSVREERKHALGPTITPHHTCWENLELSVAEPVLKPDPIHLIAEQHWDTFVWRDLFRENSVACLRIKSCDTVNQLYSSETT